VLLDPVNLNAHENVLSSNGMAEDRVKRFEAPEFSGLCKVGRCWKVGSRRHAEFLDAVGGSVA
jgi:hypothetical protein